LSYNSSDPRAYDLPHYDTEEMVEREEEAAGARGGPEERPDLKSLFEEREEEERAARGVCVCVCVCVCVYVYVCVCV
jgi:hypothetical protein